MRVLAKARSFLRNLFSSRRVETDLDQEVRSHLEMLTDENIRAGMAPKQAQRAARIELGGIDQLKEQVRERRIGAWLDSLLSDCRFALRQLRKSPAFTAVAILTLALGIGANTAIYSVVYAVLFHPLPIRDAQRVVVLHDQFPAWDLPRTSVSPFQFLELSQRSDLFESSAALKPTNLNLTGRDQSSRLTVIEATSGLFPTLGIAPILGRGFTTNDDARGSAHVLLLSHQLWRRLFNGDRKAIGQELKLDNVSYEIIGVLPEAMETLYPQADAWLPARFPAEYLNEEHRWYVGYTMLARLRHGLSLQQAQAALDIVAAGFSGEAFKVGIEVRTITDEQVGDIRRALYILLAAVGLVLLVACSNVASLLLARNAARAREIALRAAIGAARARLVMQSLMESLLLSFLGTALGLLLAHVCLAGLIRMAPPDLPHVDSIGLNWQVLLFTVALSFISAMVFGFIPSILSVRFDLAESLKERSRAIARGSGHGFRAILVTSQIALAFILLVGSGLLLRSFSKLLDVQPGFDTTNLLTMRISLPSALHGDPKQLLAFSNALLDRVATVRGVQHASVATGIPFASDGYNTTFEIRNRQSQPGQPTAHAGITHVTSSYFDALRIPLLRGRFFTPADLRYANSLDKGAVRIIDEALAKRFWPDGNPLGAQIGNDGNWATIVGVVGSVQDQDLATPSSGMIYVPSYVGTTLVLRTASDPMQLAETVRQQISSLNQDIPVYEIKTADALVATSLSRRRFATTLLTLFALLALILALVGLYGLTSYLAAQRTSEIGIRMALGAQRTNVLRLMLTQGLRMASLGVLFGLASSWLLRPVIASQLFGVGPADSFTFISVSLVFLGTATLATALPARRATRVDSMIALRYE